MDADADHCGIKRIMVFTVYHHVVQPVIIQDAVVDSFGCCTLSVDSLVGLWTAGNIRAEGTVIAGELEQGITKIILIKGRVPSPAGIRVRIVSGCGG